METEDFDPAEYEETDIDSNFESDAFTESSSNPELNDIPEQEISDRYEEQVEATISTGENFVTEGNFEASSGKIFLEGQEIISDDPEMESLLIQNFNQGIEGAFYSKTFDLGGDLYQIDYILYRFDENGASLRLDSNLISKSEEQLMASEELYEYSNDDETNAIRFVQEDETIEAEVFTTEPVAELSTDTQTSETIQQTEWNDLGWFGSTESLTEKQVSKNETPADKKVQVTELNFETLFSTTTTETDSSQNESLLAEQEASFESSSNISLFGFIDNIEPVVYKKIELDDQAETIESTNIDEAKSNSSEAKTETAQISENSLEQTEPDQLQTAKEQKQTSQKIDSPKIEPNSKEKDIEKVVSVLPNKETTNQSQKENGQKQKTDKIEKNVTTQITTTTEVSKNNFEESLEQVPTESELEPSPESVKTKSESKPEEVVSSSDSEVEKLIVPSKEGTVKIDQAKDVVEPTISEDTNITIEVSQKTAASIEPATEVNLVETEEAATEMIDQELPVEEQAKTEIIYTPIETFAESQAILDQKENSVTKQLFSEPANSSINSLETPAIATEQLEQINAEVADIEPAQEPSTKTIELNQTYTILGEQRISEEKQQELVKAEKVVTPRLGTLPKENQRIEKQPLRQQRPERQPIRLIKKDSSIKSAESKTRNTANSNRTTRPTELYSIKRQIKKVVTTGVGIERSGGISLRTNTSSITSDTRDRLEQANRISKISSNRVRRRARNQQGIKIAA